MEIVNLKDIATYSRCPAYYYFSKKTTGIPKPRMIKIIRSIIQKCYLRIAKDGYRTQWRDISGWVSAAVFKDVNVFNDAERDEALAFSEHVLVGLRNWYDKIYLKERASGYTDVKLTLNVQKFKIEDKIPIVRIDDVPSIILIDDVEIGTRQLYNSLEHRGYGWLFTKVIDDVPKVKIELLSFGPLGSFQHNMNTLDAKDNASTEDRMMNILYCMDKGINYPSVTTMCNSCEFRNKCNI